MSVCVCTPTANRGWTQTFSEACMSAQTKQPVIWIVLDNSSDPEKGWKAGNHLMQFHRVEEKKNIGWLRNRCLELALQTQCQYIVFWDDDDYYPPTRISSGVEALNNSTAPIAASSKMFLLLTRENVLMTTGPFSGYHGTAATYTLRREYALTHRFGDTKGYAEETAFTENWSTPIVQVEPRNTIVVMGHTSNTIDKSQLVSSPGTFNAIIINDSNGKQAFRSMWNLSPALWGLWRTTFSV